jgi:glutamyl-tRNA synthetase
MDDNFLDTVLLKKNGIPTYHFAHLVDDRLMRTTHVMRAEEWLPSLPLHYQLFRAFDLPVLKYAHTAQLMKIENGNKRKLSKRKDPEANVAFFFEAGYPVLAIKNYLCGIFDSGFEDWKMKNMDLPFSDYVFDFARMPKSGALFDLKKLDSVSNIHLSHLSNEELFAQMLDWTGEFRPELHAMMIAERELAFRAIGIQRGTERDPKKFTRLSDVEAYLAPFLRGAFEALKSARGSIALPVPKELAIEVVNDYIEHLDLEMNANDWISWMREEAAKFKFARDGAEFKAGGCVGKFGDYAMIIRVAVAGGTNSPDLYEMMRALGADETRKRLGDFADEMHNR